MFNETMYTIKVCEVGYQLVVGIQMLILTLTDNGTANICINNYQLTDNCTANIWINNYQLTDNCTANIWITNYQLTDNCTANIWINNYQLTDNGTANIWINSYQLTDNCTANSWINNYQLTANFTVLQYDNPETTQHFESVRTSKNWFWIWTRLDHAKRLTLSSPDTNEVLFIFGSTYVLHIEKKSIHPISSKVILTIATWVQTI